MVKKWASTRVGSSACPPPNSRCTTSATPLACASSQNASSSGDGAPEPLGHWLSCRPRTPGIAADARQLARRVGEGRRRQQADAEQPLGRRRGVVAEEVVVAPAHRDRRLAREPREGARAEERREQHLRGDAVVVELAQALRRVARAREPAVVGDGRGPRTNGGEEQVRRERHDLAGHRHRPRRAAVDLGDRRHEGAELGVHVGTPDVGRHLEVRVGRDHVADGHARLPGVRLRQGA